MKFKFLLRLLLFVPFILFAQKPHLLLLKVYKDQNISGWVIGYKLGQGKFKGMLSSLICKLDNNTTFNLGSGFSVKERKNPPKIGSIITFKYKEFTKSGKSRFPVFLREKITDGI